MIERMVVALLTLSAFGASNTASALTRPTSSIAPTPASAITPDAADSLESFWTRFRTAALASDAAAIRSMSAPVVLQRGTLDDTPVVRLPASKVPGVIALILALPDGVDRARRSHRELLEVTPVPKPGPEEPADEYRFGDLMFERGADGWRSPNSTTSRRSSVLTRPVRVKYGTAIRQGQCNDRTDCGRATDAVGAWRMRGRRARRRLGGKRRV